MAYIECFSDPVGTWKEEARSCVDTIRRLATDEDDLIFTIMKGNCYDHLRELIDAAKRMKRLILSAEQTFSTKIIDESGESEEKDDERLDNMHETILDVKSSVEKCLVNTMETMKMEIEEIRESTNTMIAYMDNEKSQKEQEETAKPARKWTEVRRRQCNLMIFGSFEQGDDYSTEVKEILKHVGVNIRANEFYITEIKTGESNRKSILRVEFDSPDPVQIAMMNARRLKSFDKRVYIANDLSYQERARLRVKVQELKVKIEQQPEIYWTIKGCRIVSLGPRRTSDLVEHKPEIAAKSEIESVYGLSDTASEEEGMRLTYVYRHR
ncbi:hypothetical protein ACHWQZ_G009440 [Mnemiopsis leidyi]